MNRSGTHRSRRAAAGQVSIDTPALDAVGNAPSPDPAGVAPRRIFSAELFRGVGEVHIDHHGQRYRLRQTRQGKLILTK